MCVCVCVCVCVRACVRACVCVCVERRRKVYRKIADATKLKPEISKTSWQKTNEHKIELNGHLQSVYSEQSFAVISQFQLSK